MKIAVAYYRVSTNQQGESKLGLDAQGQSVLAYAKVNAMNVITSFTEVESGRKNKRPMLHRALAYCKKHKAVLLIAKLDRLGRNVAFISALMESQVSFIAVDMPSANKLMLHIVAAFAQYEREQISIRTKEALAAAKRRGVKLGENGKVLAQRNSYRSDQFARQMQPIIEELMIKHGITSIRQIARELTQRKITTYHSGTRWHKTSVHILLRKLQLIKSGV